MESLKTFLKDTVGIENPDEMINNLINQGGAFLKNLIIAILIYLIGKMIVKLLTNLLVKVMEKSVWDDAFCLQQRVSFTGNQKV